MGGQAEMSKSMAEKNTQKMNGTIDIVKLLMAILVIGIHTEPFGFHFWLDKGFGICTRLCVPFFFVTSAYFYWRKERSAKSFLSRIVLLYVIWSVIYLPFDIPVLREMSIPQLLNRFLWAGNGYGLWYLCGTITGFIITYLLLKIMQPDQVLIIAVIMLIIGTMKTTYSTALQQVFGISLTDYLGTRNGVFYGFPYIALGMFTAKTASQGKTDNRKKLYTGFFISLLLLIIESYLFVIRFKADATILWLSVFPCTYFFFRIVSSIDIQINQNISFTFRKMSTLLYVSQFLFIPILSRYLSNVVLFIATVIAAGITSLMIIKLSELKYLRFLKYLY